MKLASLSNALPGHQNYQADIMRQCLCIVGQRLFWATRGAHNPKIQVAIMYA